jgi:OmpA-OmpF porin, OOP family
MLKNDDNFRFGRSNEVPVISQPVSSTIDSLVAYARSHPERRIIITGYYSMEEKNNTTFNNIGLARAAGVQKVLVEKGMADSLIATNAVVTDSLYFTKTDTLAGGISFFIDKTPLSAVAEELLFAPRTVYFNTGSNTLAITPELETYLLQAGAYLTAHPEKKLQLTGYTDSVGNPISNNALSLARAGFVKNALIKKGLPDNQMVTAGRGMLEPIAGNNTAAGRAKNRRVSITLQ